MSNPKIHVSRTCYSKWTVAPSYLAKNCDDISPEFSAGDGLRWRLRLTIINDGKGLKVSLRVNAEEKCHIAGKGTITIICEELSTGSTQEQLKFSFVCDKENYLLRYGVFVYHGCINNKINGNNILPDDMTLVSEVSYLNTNDILPIFLSGRYVVVPMERNTFLSADGGGLEELYLSEKFSDVVLCVNGTDYHAHKNILATCSEVFEAMFQHEMQENKLNRVEIEDIDEQAFLQALRFMYAGKIEVEEETFVYDLLSVADRYDIKGLKTLCRDILLSKINVNTVLKILLFADSRHNMANLRARAIKFVTEYSKDVLHVLTPGEMNEIKSRPDLMMDLLDLFMNK